MNGCKCHGCTCKACCSCKCICGKWQGLRCRGVAYDGTPTSCHCHDPVDPDDWFPTDQLQQSFHHLRQVLLSKLGVDLEEIFSNLQMGQFSVIRIPILSFIGSSGTVVKYVEFDIEEIGQYSFVPVVRLLCLGMLFLTLIQCVLVILRQY